MFFSPNENGKDINKYYVDDTKITTEDTGDFLSIISGTIKEESSVLDVGCAQGRLGRKLSSKSCKLIGIDINQEAVNYAKQQGFYTDVFFCDISQIDHEAFQRVKSYGPYDSIVLADVLEHLKDPTETLLQVRELLKEDGKILVSVPNIANNDICLNLLNGRFNYSKMGILDNTHLKFFTRDSFFQWIELINFTYPNRKLYCMYLGATYYTSEYVREIEKSYPILSHVLSARPEADAFQLLFLLSKQANVNPIQQNENFDCVIALGELLENHRNLFPNASFPQTERETLIRMIKNNETWIAEQDKLIQWYRNGKSKEETAFKKVEQDVQQQEIIDCLEKTIVKKEEHIKQCEQIIANQKEAIRVKDEWITKQHENTDYLQEINANKEEQIRQCEEVIANQKEAIRVKDEWIAKQDENTEYLKQVCAEKETVIRQYEQTIQSQKEEIALRDKFAARQMDIAQEEIAELKQRLLDIENTKIWRRIGFLKKEKDK